MGKISKRLKVVLGVADVWGARKGLFDFIELREKLDDNYLIVLVGVTDKIQKMLPNGILGIKRTQNQQELARIYAVADLFVNLIYEDNYPTTNLEAMACGTPVLIYRTGGSVEAITDETGWIVQKGDIDSAVQIIKSSGCKTSAISEACRMRAIKYFDKNRSFDNYVSLYLDKS